MKKGIMLSVLLASLLLILSGCGKSNEDKLQGKWKADDGLTQDYIGDSMKIDKHNVKVNGHDNEDTTNIKYFNFKDKDDKDPKHIRFYGDKPQSESFDKGYPDIEGVIHFKDNNTISIDAGMGSKYKFKKE